MATSSSSEELSGVLECRDKEFFLPCMNVQCDWSEAAAKYVDGGREDKFWISCRRPVDGYVDSLRHLQSPPVLDLKEDSRTVHGHIQVRGQGEERVLESVSDRFTVTKTTPSSVTVECRYSNGGCRTTFIKPKKTIHLHPKTLSCMDISGSCALGVCASENGKLWVWDPDTGETRRELRGHLADVETCRFFPSGIVVLSGGADMRLKIWSAQDGTCPRTLIGHTGGITDTAFIDRGKNIVSVSRDGTARLWDCGSASCLGTIASTDKPISSCSISSSDLVGKRNPTQPLAPECGTNDKLVALACGDRYLRGVDIRSRKKAFQVFCRVPSSCEFVSDHEVVCGGEDGVLLTWDIRNPSNAKTECLYLTESAVTSLTAVNAQSCLAGHADGTAILWRLDEPFAPVSKLTGPDIDRVTSIRIHGNNIYTSCRDGCVRVYSTNDITH